METGIGLFDALESISPWWWVALGIAIGAIEMLTMSFFLIWWGLAAIVMAILLVIMPGMPGELQVMIFAALSMVLTFVGRNYIAKHGDGAEPVSGLNERSDALVGRSGKVIESTGNEGRVEIDGIPWKARSVAGAMPQIDGAVEVTASDGVTLSVKPA